MDEISVAPGLRERLEDLGGRRRDAALLAAVVVALAVVALVVWGRSAPAQVAPPATSSSEDPVASSPSGEHPPEPTDTIYVHVAGAVRAPGLYAVAAGARVWDAIEAAGGPSRRADLDLLNLAQILTDGMKVEVLRRGDGASAAAAPAAEPGADGAATTVVSINTGDQAALETVPGLGPVKAGAIVRYRTETGPFTALEQILEVSGIGPATFEQIRPFIAL